LSIVPKCSEQAIFGEAVVAHYDPLYIGIWSGALTVLGLAALVDVRDHVHR
jgi:hypothetical protein